jgi:hypothetical protein
MVVLSCEPQILTSNKWENFVLSLLALHFSERTFSEMNLLISELRKQGLLQSLLSIRSYMARHSVCCNSFTQSSDMLSRITADIYMATGDDDDSLPVDF